MATNKKSKKSSKSTKSSKKKSLSSRFNLKNALALLVIAILTVLGIKILFVSHADTPTINGTPVGIAASASPTGYWIAASDGGVFAEGTAPYYGSMGGKALSAPIVKIAPTVDKNGYYLIGSDGAVYAFGDAQYNGGLNGGSVYNKISYTGNVIGMAAHVGGGYWIMTSTGGVYALGGAPFYGNYGTDPGTSIVSIVATPSGNGYWATNNIGHVYGLGDAWGIGQASQPGVSNIIGVTAASKGYNLLGADGGVFALSGSQYYGGMAGSNPKGGIIGGASTSDGKGYWLIGGDGGIFAYGDAVYQGRVTPTAPIINSFTQNVTNVASGQPVTLNYSVTNATQVSITGYSGALSPSSGSANVTPTNTSGAYTKVTYTLSAINNGNSPGVAQVVVGVCPEGTVVNAAYGCVTPGSLNHCPAGQVGIPPNCSSPSQNQCPSGQTGYPNCVSICDTTNSCSTTDFSGTRGHYCYLNFDWISLKDKAGNVTGGECVLNLPVASAGVDSTVQEMNVINSIAGNNFVHVDVGNNYVYPCTAVIGCHN